MSIAIEIPDELIEQIADRVAAKLRRGGHATATPSDESHLTPAQVAERLNLSYAAVARALREGRLPGRKVLGSWRIDPAELRDWIDGQQSLPRSRKPSSRKEFLEEIRAVRRAQTG